MKIKIKVVKSHMIILFLFYGQILYAQNCLCEKELNKLDSNFLVHHIDTIWNMKNDELNILYTNDTNLRDYKSYGFDLHCHLKTSISFRDKKVHGIMKYFFNTGEVEEEKYFNNGEVVLQKDFLIDNMLLQEIFFKNEEEVMKIRYYHSEKFKIVTFYKNQKTINSIKIPIED